MAEQDLDLLNPGRLWATAEHQKDVTFHICFPDDGSKKENIKDGDVDPGLDMIPPVTVPFTAVDGNGVANFDLDASGKAMEMLQQLTRYYEGGGQTIETVRAVVVATARDGNKIPEKAVVEVMEMNLVACPIIMLKPIKDYVTVQNYKAGVKYFQVGLKIKGPLSEVEISCAPDAEITAKDVKGKGKIVVPIKEGDFVEILVPVPFVQGKESQQRAVPRKYAHYYPWGWRTAGGRVEYDSQEYSRETWKGGKATLTVSGTKQNAKAKQSAVLTAEDCASDWLAGPPPPPFYHNNC